MASTATSRLRLNKQGTYDNPETWGIELNNGMIDMVDDAFGGFTATISGDVTLSVENYTEDQARKMFMILDGAGGFTVTVPAVDKMYFVDNQCAADVTVKPAGGTGAVIRAGTKAWWYCDGTNGFVQDPTLDQIKPPVRDVDLGGQKLVDVATPTDPDDAATKGYIDDLAALSDLGTVAAIAPQVVIVASIQDGTVATNAVTDVAGVADEILLLAPRADDISQLAGMFCGAASTDPSTRLDGSPLEAGDYYLNTSGTPTVNVYDGSGWVPIEAMAIASSSEATTGTNNTSVMTPLRTSEHLAARTGTTAGKLVALDGAGKLPAVDGSQLTNLPQNGLGLGQTWQSPSRSPNTSYQNLTGKPIMVGVTAQYTSSGSSWAAQVSSDNSTWVTIGTGDPGSGSGTFYGSLVVPPGWYYKFTGLGTVSSWRELR